MMKLNILKTQQDLWNTISLLVSNNKSWNNIYIKVDIILNIIQNKNEKSNADQFSTSPWASWPSDGCAKQSATSPKKGNPSIRSLRANYLESQKFEMNYVTNKTKEKSDKKQPTRHGLVAGHLVFIVWPTRAAPPPAAANVPRPRGASTWRGVTAATASTAVPPMITALGSTPRQLLAQVMLLPFASWGRSVSMTLL